MARINDDLLEECDGCGELMVECVCEEEEDYDDLEDDDLEDEEDDEL